MRKTGFGAFIVHTVAVIAVKPQPCNILCSFMQKKERKKESLKIKPTNICIKSHSKLNIKFFFFFFFYLVTFLLPKACVPKATCAILKSPILVLIIINLKNSKTKEKR